MAKSIKANGKLNGEEIAKVRENIAQVRNLHIKSQDAGEVLKEGLSRLQASSQFINDIGGTAEAMRQMIRDPSVLTSETDLSSKFNELIAKNTNYNAIVDARVNAIAKNVQATEEDITMPDGSIMKVKYKKIPGVIFDPVDMKLKVNKARVGQEGLNALSPGELKGLKSVLGAGQVFPGVSVEDAAQTMYENSLIAQSGLSITVDQTAAKAQKEIYDAKVAKVTADNIEDKIKLEQENTRSLIESREESIKIAQKNASTSAERLALAKKLAQFKIDNPDYTEEEDYDFVTTPFGASDGSVDYGTGFSMPLEVKIDGVKVDADGIAVDKDGTVRVFETVKGKRQATTIPSNKVGGLINSLENQNVRKNVKELVEKLNWSIEVRSKGNAGSEFIVIIPK
jgi:hypothetical protein